MPDAGRTREPCVQRECTLRTQATTGSAGTTDIPCAMVLTAAPYSPRCTGLFSHRRVAKRPAKLDPSVGGTGPYGLTVREDAFVGALPRAETSSRPPHPTSNVRDDRDTPLLWRRDGRRQSCISEKWKRNIFCPRT